MKDNTKYLIAVALCFILFACNCQKQFITVTDTLVTKEVNVDTLWQPAKYDTIYLNKDKLHVRVETKVDTVTQRQLIKIYGECAADTVITEKIVEVPIIKEKKDYWSLIRAVFVGLIIGVVGMFIFIYAIK